MQTTLYPNGEQSGAPAFIPRFDLTCQARLFVPRLPAPIAATLQLLMFFFISLFAFVPVHYLPADVSEVQNPEQWPEYFVLPVVGGAP